MTIKIIPALIAGLLLATTSSVEAKTEKTTSDSKPLITHSVIIAPKQVGNYSLVSLDYDPKAKFAGASIRYQNSDLPGMSFDLFVYPLGRGPETQSVKKGMLDFRESLESAMGSGFFTNLKVYAETDFVIEKLSDSNDDGSVDKPKSKATPNEKKPVPDKDAEIGKIFAEANKINGKKLSFTYAVDSGNLNSRGLIFHRQLYLTKVRVSIADGTLPNEDFDAIVDNAARALVPAIETRNTGDCINVTIYVSPPDKSKSDEENTHKGAMEMIRSMAGIKNENCQKDLKIKKISDDFEFVEIEYNADDWGG